MKKFLSLVLTVVMTATILCACTEEHSVKVSKSGKTKISLFAAVPVAFIQEIEEQMGTAVEDLQAEDLNGMSTGDDYTQQFEDMEIQKVNGEECYVGEETFSFSTTKKANEYMLDNYGEHAAGYFKKFNVTTIGFSATVMNNISDIIQASGASYTIKLKITLPYIITKTNGALSDDKKTVTFDLLDSEKIYAYTTKSGKSAKIYFKKDYLKSNDTAYLSWNTVKGAKKYTVQYRAAGDSKWKSTSTTKTAKLVKGLKAGKKYTFKVTATTKSKKYTSINTYITTLKKVTASVKSTTTKTVKLSWKKNTNSDGYMIYQKTSKSGSWKLAKTIKDPYTATFTVKSLKPNKKYYFKVVSYSNEYGRKVKSLGDTVTAKTK